MCASIECVNSHRFIVWTRASSLHHSGLRPRAAIWAYNIFLLEAMAPGLSSGTYLIINPFQAPFSFLIFIFPFFPSFLVFLLSLPPFFPSFLLFLLFHDPPYRIGSERLFLNNKPKAAVTMDMPTIDRNDELYIALNVDRVLVFMNSEQLERLPETLYK